MTAIPYREYTLLCDHPGCTRQYGPFGVERARAALRRLARRDGWASVLTDGMSVSATRDYCPAHKPA